MKIHNKTERKENLPDKIMSKLEGILRPIDKWSFIEYNLPNYCLMNISLCLIKRQLFGRKKERKKKRGRKKGRKRGREGGRKEGRKRGREGGRKEGREGGREEGREGGRKEGRKEGGKEGRARKISHSSLTIAS